LKQQSFHLAQHHWHLSEAKGCEVYCDVYVKGQQLLHVYSWMMVQPCLLEVSYWVLAQTIALPLPLYKKTTMLVFTLA
jgi:hypothetical protein